MGERIGGIVCALACAVAVLSLETWAFVADVTKFGAKGDGATDDTAAVQRAIDAVAAAATKMISRSCATSQGILFGNKPNDVNVQIDLLNFEGGQTTGVPPFVSHLKFGIFDPGNRLHGSITWHELSADEMTIW